MDFENTKINVFIFAGRIDASMKVTIHRQPHFKKGLKDIQSEVLHVPFELKTGKMHSKLGKYAP